MTKTEHLLDIAAEECAELSIRLIKAARFGLDQVQPESHTDAKTDTSKNPEGLDNRARIRREYCHLIASMEQLGFNLADIDWMDRQDQDEVVAKISKIDRYLEISRDYGTLQPDPPAPIKPDHVCEHGVAVDVHCCGEGGLPYPGCHSGFVFDISQCQCKV